MRLECMEIRAGDLLKCETAGGGHVTMRALGTVEQGYDFPVVWVCTPEEYDRAQEAEDEADGLPWPYSAVRVVADGIPHESALAATPRGA
jgi:hypothetical protein